MWCRPLCHHHHLIWRIQVVPFGRRRWSSDDENTMVEEPCCRIHGSAGCVCWWRERHAKTREFSVASLLVQPDVTMICSKSKLFIEICYPPLSWWVSGLCLLVNIYFDNVLSHLNKQTDDTWMWKLIPSHMVSGRKSILESHLTQFFVRLDVSVCCCRS